MTGFFTRTLVALCVTLGILAPQGGALAAAAGLADGRVMVICTGDGLRLMRIGADGRPVDVSQSAEPCALTDAAGTAVPAAPGLAAHLPRPAAAPLAPRAPRALARAHRPCLPRAPPFA